MNTTGNMLSHPSSVFKHTDITNKGFILLDSLFKENGWHLIKNDSDWIIYSKFGFETDYFELKLDYDKIHVSIPLKNSQFQYKTSFNNYFQASEYIEDKLKEYVLSIEKKIE